MSTGATISVCIVCRNEADKLGPCLKSVAWADEVIVLDLDSSDDSAEVAREHGARVIRHEPVPVVEAVRNVVAESAKGGEVLVSQAARDQLPEDGFSFGRGKRLSAPGAPRGLSVCRVEARS